MEVQTFLSLKNHGEEWEAKISCLDLNGAKDGDPKQVQSCIFFEATIRRSHIQTTRMAAMKLANEEIAHFISAQRSTK